MTQQPTPQRIEQLPIAERGNTTLLQEQAGVRFHVGDRAASNLRISLINGGQLDAPAMQTVRVNMDMVMNGGQPSAASQHQATPASASEQLDADKIRDALGEIYAHQEEDLSDAA